MSKVSSYCGVITCSKSCVFFIDVIEVRGICLISIRNSNGYHSDLEKDKLYCPKMGSATILLY